MMHQSNGKFILIGILNCLQFFEWLESYEGVPLQWCEGVITQQSVEGTGMRGLKCFTINQLMKNIMSLGLARQGKKNV